MRPRRRAPATTPAGLVLMTRFTFPQRGLFVPAVSATLAASVAVAAQVAAHPGPFHPSRMLSVAAEDPLATLISKHSPDFQFTVPADHYDGIYYLAMALDPLARGEAHDLIDLAAYRYGHPLYGWLGALFSGGNLNAMPWVFWALSVFSMAAAAAMMSVLARRLGASAWLGLLVSFMPGLIYSASTALTEPLQVALICAMLLAWTSQRRSWIVIALLGAALSLTKEQLVLVPVALGISEAWHWLRHRTFDWRPIPALLTGPLVLATWLAYVRNQFTAEQSTYDDGNVGLPGTGWLQTFEMANQMRVSDFLSSQIGSTVVPALIATAVLLLLASLVGIRYHRALGLVVLFQALLVSTLGWRTLLFPHEMFRIPSVAVAMALFTLGAALSTRAVETTPLAVPAPTSVPKARQ